MRTGKLNMTHVDIPRYYEVQFLWRRGCPRGVMVKAIDCGIVVSDLERLLRIHFRANTLEKGMNPLILPAMG